MAALVLTSNICTASLPVDSGRSRRNLRDILVWIWLVFAGDADAVVCESGMHAGNFDWRHVAGDAIFCCDWASGARTIAGRFLVGRCGVTREAILIVRAWIQI